MTEQEQDLKIYTIANSISQTLGLELVELKIGRHKNDIMIQILADRPQGGITIQECSLLNRSIVEGVDKEAFLSEDGYSLEVSSPGLDRPISTFKDFLKNVNNKVRIELNERFEGKMEYVGILKAVTQETLTLLINKDSKELVIPMDKVVKALLEI